MRNIAYLIGIFLLPLHLFGGDGDHFFVDSTLRNDTPEIKVRPYIHHISDINVRDQEYKIELWLYVSSKDSLWGWDSLEKQFEVSGAKEMTVSIIPQYQKTCSQKIYDPTLKDSIYRKLIKINCTMTQDWDVDNYPFDKQELDIFIYTIRPLRWVKLIPYSGKIVYMNDKVHSMNAIENGWFFDNALGSVKPAIQKDIFDLNKKYSAIHLHIGIFRREMGALFFKLFIGMYVSFFVAFIALFINVRHVEPRFGLPVGGLFAAIGNKYIMESILPQTSEFTIVDTLHTLTIIAILMIILFSAISLKFSERNSSSSGMPGSRRSSNHKLTGWIDRNGSKLIFVAYASLNVIAVTWGLIHEI